MEGIKTIKVINDIELEFGGDIITISAGLSGRCRIAIVAAELPALLDRLNAAAEAMGVATAVPTGRVAWLRSAMRLAREQLENGSSLQAHDTLDDALRALDVSEHEANAKAAQAIAKAE